MTGEQSALGVADHECDVGRHSAGGAHPGVRIHAGGLVHCGDLGPRFVPEPCHFSGEREEGGAQRTARSGAEQPI